MLIQNPKAVDIPGFPRLFPAAEMQYRRVLHNPLHIINAAAAQQIAAVLLHIPKELLRRNSFASLSLKIQKPLGALSLRGVFQAATAVYTAVMQ